VGKFAIDGDQFAASGIAQRDRLVGDSIEHGASIHPKSADDRRISR